MFHLGVTFDGKAENYALCLIKLFVVLMQLNDSARGYRNVTTWKCLVWLFKANINLSNYTI